MRTRGFVDQPVRRTGCGRRILPCGSGGAGVTLAGDLSRTRFDVQIVLIDRSNGTNNGNFDIEFNYGNGSDQIPPVGTESNPNANGFQGFKLGPNSAVRRSGRLVLSTPTAIRFASASAAASCAIADDLREYPRHHCRREPGQAPGFLLPGERIARLIRFRANCGGVRRGMRVYVSYLSEPTVRRRQTLRRGNGASPPHSLTKLDQQGAIMSQTAGRVVAVLFVFAGALAVESLHAADELTSHYFRTSCVAPIAGPSMSDLIRNAFHFHWVVNI